MPFTDSFSQLHVTCIAASRVSKPEAGYPTEPVCLEGSFLIDDREAWETMEKTTTGPGPGDSK